MALRVHIETAITVVLTACALLVTGTVLRNGRQTVPSGAYPIPPVDTTQLQDWPEIRAAGVFLTDSAPQVTIAVFSDFECPFCRRFHGTLREFLSRNPDRAGAVFVHYPLSYHRFASLAARAAECAHEQGRFGELVDQLFDLQDSLGIVSWRVMAERARLPRLGEFDTCITSRADMPRVIAGRALGERLRLRGTPTVIVNGWTLRSIPDVEELERVVADVAAGRNPYASVR